MKINSSIISLTILLLFAQGLFAQKTIKKVLFFGNSYTAGLPELIAELAESVGDSLIFHDGSGGQTIKDHATSPHSYVSIAQEHWDYVVIQCQSQEPSFRPSYVNTNVFPYAKMMADSVKHYNPCGKTMFYMTWGRKNGDASNCASYPPVCTFEGMQMRLRESYLKMGFDNDAFVCPVGMAWRHARQNTPSIELYDADESHPSMDGMFLTACTFYTAIFEKSPSKVKIPGGIYTREMDSLKNSAEFIVSDSLATWNINYDSFDNNVTYSLNSDTIEFTNNNMTVTSAQWDFGDGNQSMQINPTHVYGRADTFTVTASSFVGCFQIDTVLNVITTLYKGAPIDTTDTTKDTTIIKPNGIFEFEEGLLNVFPNPSNGEINVILNLKGDINISLEFVMYNVNGEEVWRENLTEQETNLDLSNIKPGVYFYSIENRGKYSKKQKLILLE